MTAEQRKTQRLIDALDGVAEAAKQAATILAEQTTDTAELYRKCEHGSTLCSYPKRGHWCSKHKAQLAAELAERKTKAAAEPDTTDHGRANGYILDHAKGCAVQSELPGEECTCGAVDAYYARLQRART